MRRDNAIFALLLSATLAMAAPAPLARAPRPREGAGWLPGEWRLGWQYHRKGPTDRACFWVRFAADGTYVCGTNGSEPSWVGTYRACGLRLTLHERMLHDPSWTVRVYEFTADGTPEGDPPLVAWLERPPATD